MRRVECVNRVLRGENLLQIMMKYVSVISVRFLNVGVQSRNVQSSIGN